ncbi:hypothetical protein B5X24_HaOG215145 [Helicoverpa armigera]|nr:hypothetical protein B5X24_HaOG215145 [Helicoverpa armigera]
MKAQCGHAVRNVNRIFLKMPQKMVFDSKTNTRPPRFRGSSTFPQKSIPAAVFHQLPFVSKMCFAESSHIDIIAMKFSCYYGGFSLGTGVGITIKKCPNSPPWLSRESSASLNRAALSPWVLPNPFCHPMCRTKATTAYIHTPPEPPVCRHQTKPDSHQTRPLYLNPSPRDLAVIGVHFRKQSGAQEILRLLRRLPAGHAHVCMDVAALPQIMQQIFASSLLQSS